VATGVNKLTVVQIDGPTAAGTTGSTATLRLCDTTADLETFAFRGNYNDTLRLVDLPWDVDIELQGGTFLKSDGPTGTANVGTLDANFMWAGAPAVINLVHSVAGDTRPVYVAGLNLDNAKSITFNSDEGSAVINAIAGNDLEDLIFSATGNVSILETIHIDDITHHSVRDTDDTGFLSSIDASGVQGDLTLETEGDAAGSGFTFVASQGETTLTLDDITAGFHSSFSAMDAATFVLVIDGVTDIANAELTNVDQVSLLDGATVTMTQAQVLEIGTSNITTHPDLDAATTQTLNLMDFGSAGFDTSAVADDVVVAVTMAAGSHVIDPTTDFSNVVEFDMNGAEVTMTADQLIQLAEALAATGDMDTFVSELEGAVLNITGVTQAHADWSVAFNDSDPEFNFSDLLGRLSGDDYNEGLAGTITLAESVVLADANYAVYDELGFAFEIGDFTLGLSTPAQADDLVVTGGADSMVDLLFYTLEGYGTDIDVDGYDIGNLRFPDLLVAGGNVDTILDGLAETVNKIIHNDPIGLVDQTADVAPGTIVRGDLTFDHEEDYYEIENFTLSLLGGAVVDGDINLSTSDYNDNWIRTYLKTVVINSTGTAGNFETGETDNIITGRITSDVYAQGDDGYDDNGDGTNNILDVTINADQDLRILGGIDFEYQKDAFQQDTAHVEDRTALLTVNGTADVFVGALDTTDDDVDGVDVINNGTGTLTVTLDGAMLDQAADNNDALSFTGSGDIVLSVIGNVDLSDDDLSAVTQIDTADNAEVTLTFAQLTALGGANVIGDGALVISDWAGQPFDFTSIGEDVYVTLMTATGAIVVDAATDFAGVDGFELNGAQITLSAQQLIDLGESLAAAANGINLDISVTGDGEGTRVDITGLTQAQIDWTYTTENGTVYTFEDMLQAITEPPENGTIEVVDDVTLSATILNDAAFGGFELVGNGDPDLRVDVVMDDPNLAGDPNGGATEYQRNEVGGNRQEGVTSRGIATYVVTVLDDTTYTVDGDGDGDGNGNGNGYPSGTMNVQNIFYVCNSTEDLTTLGLQGNENGTIFFEGVKRGVDFLMEGDGFASWADVEKVDYSWNESNIGSLVASFYTPDNPYATVTINNQNTVLTDGSTPGGERILSVGDIQINNVIELRINVEHGDAVINSINQLDGIDDAFNGNQDLPGTTSDQATSLVLTAVEDLTINQSLSYELENVDATEVMGAFTASLDNYNHPFTLTTGPEATITLNAVTFVDGSVIDGSAGDLTLVIDNSSDLSEAVLNGVDAVEIREAQSVTLTADQVVDIQEANISGVESDTNTSEILHVNGLSTQVIDQSLLGEDVVLGTVTTTAGTFTLNPGTDLTGANLILADGADVTMTVDQFMAITADGTLDTVNAVLNGNASLHLTGLTQAHVDAGFDLDLLTGIEGSVSLAEDVTLGTFGTLLNTSRVLSLETAVDLNGFTVVMDDNQTLTLVTIEQADGLDVSGGTDTTLVLYFDQDPITGLNSVQLSDGWQVREPVDASGWLVTNVSMMDDLIKDRNMGDFQGLPQGICVKIYDAPEYNSVMPIDRCITLEEGVIVDGFIAMNDLQGDSSVVQLTLNMLGGTQIDGELVLTTVVAEDDAGNPLQQNYFDQLIINSEVGVNDPIHNAVNVISGNIRADDGDLTNSYAGDNNLLDIVINANGDLRVDGDIIFSSVDEVVDHPSGIAGMDDAVMVVTGVADVTLAGLNTLDPDLDSLTITSTSTGVLTITLDSDAVSVGGTSAATGATITLDGSAGGGINLIIEDGANTPINLSDATLSGINGVALDDGDTVILTQAQIIDMGGESAITVLEDGDAATLHIVDFDPAVAFDATLIGEGIDVNTITLANGGVLNSATDLTDVDQIIVPEGETLTLTADQFQQLLNAGQITGIDADGNSTTEFSVVITGLTQDHVDDGLDLSAIGADNVYDVDGNLVSRGITVHLDGDVNLKSTTVLGTLADLEFVLDGTETLGLATINQLSPTGNATFNTSTGLWESTVEAGDGLTVTGNADNSVELQFVGGFGPYNTFDASGIDVGYLRMPNVLVADRDVDLLQDIGDDYPVTKVIYNSLGELPGYVRPIDQVVIIEQGTSEDPNVVPGFLVFNDYQDDSAVVSLTITMEGDTSIDGNLRLTTVAKDPELLPRNFDTLTINSWGDPGQVNSITGDISPLTVNANTLENDLLNVVIDAQVDFTVGGAIYFNSTDTDGTDEAAELSLTGTADVTVEQLNIDDTNGDGIDTLTIDNQLAGGTLTVTGSSPGIADGNTAASDAEEIIIKGTGHNVFGTTGESATLPVEEHMQVIKAVIGQARGRVPRRNENGAVATADRN